MNLQEEPNLSIQELPETSTYRTQLQSLSDQMPHILEDFQEYYVLTNMNPLSIEYQNMYQSIVTNISNVNSQAFTITNDIEKNIETINYTLKALNANIVTQKQENVTLKKQLGVTDGTIDTSEQLIDEYKDTYNMTYLQNFNKIVGIVIAIYFIRKIFYK
jgi:hypothetical protein